MKYLFVLGRNIELSLAEIISSLESTGEYEIKDNLLLIELKKPLPNDTIKRLGGTISFGKVLFEGNVGKLINEIEKSNIYNEKESKFNYSIYQNSDDDFQIVEAIKEKFKLEKLKAIMKPLGANLEMQSRERFQIAPNNATHQYFIFKSKGKNYFGKIEEKCDYEELEKRDMEKPKRRESLAISPRLAKIMINLSQAKKNDIILDPFCGIGVILQEALIQGIKVVGVDKNPKAIEGAKENLKWGKFDRSMYKLINMDSKEVNLDESNAIVFEPYLGEALKKVPPEGIAKKTIINSENLVIDVINNLKKNCKGRIVFTLPYIKTIKGRVSPDVDRIESKANLKLVKFEGLKNPLPEFREGQIVGRMIFVLEK